jgi:ankyrin repeat protein
MDYAPKGYVNCVRGEDALRQAATAGQTDIIRWLLDYGVDPYCTQTRKDEFESWGHVAAPPVVIAARSGHTEAAKLLLDAMPDFNYVRSLEESPVFGFVVGKQTALLESILRRGINVDQRDTCGRTALLHAIKHEHISGVTLLLEFGADASASDNCQITPLYVAAEMGLEAVVELLLQRGARVDDTKVYGAYTPLDAAILANSIKAVSLLIEHGANVNAFGSCQQTTLQRSISHDTEGRISKLLLDAGADFTARTSHNITPLNHACWLRNKENVRLLLHAIEARGAVSELLESPTTLLPAAIFARHDLAYRLLAQGADVDKPVEGGSGQTALMEAARQEQYCLFDLVLQKSLDVNAADPWGRTALSFAAEQGSEHKVRSLLKKNASDFASKPDCDTPLTYAAKSHHIQVVLLLLFNKQRAWILLMIAFAPL